MKTYFTLLSTVLLLFQACSSQKNVETKRKKTENGEPVWLYAASDGCSSSEICAVGQGQNLAESDIHAKKAIAAIFSTKIDAEFTVSKQSFSDKEYDELKESVQDTVTEQVNEVLKGVEIKEHFQKNEIHFALASLDKRKVSRALTQELKRLDNELEHFMSLKRKVLIKKMTTLYYKREQLNEKLILINGGGINSPVRYSDIDGLKYLKNTKDIVKLDLAPEVPSVLGKKVTEFFTDLGYKIVSGNANFDYFVHVDYEGTQEYLKVKGFEKFLFTLKLEASNQDSKMIGTYIVKKSSIGRTENDAFVKVRSNMIEEIIQNIDKLNLN